MGAGIAPKLVLWGVGSSPPLAFIWVERLPKATPKAYEVSVAGYGSCERQKMRSVCPRCWNVKAVAIHAIPGLWRLAGLRCGLLGDAPD